MREKIRRGLGLFLAAALLALAFTAGSPVSAATLPREEGRKESTEDISEKDPAAQEESEEENAGENTEESQEETADEIREEENGEQPDAGSDGTLKETEAPQEVSKASVGLPKSSAAREVTLPVGSETQTESSYVSLEVDGKTLYYGGYGLGVIAAFKEAEGRTAVITILKGDLNLNADGGECVAIDSPAAHITLRMAEGAALSGNQEGVGVITVKQGTLVVESGKIINNYWNREDASDPDCNSYGIYVTGTGKAMLCGGMIQTVATPLNTSYAVCVDGGSFTMTSGSISAQQTGGSGVYVKSGRADIQGGTIQNVARGVCVSGENGYAEITGNTDIATVSLNGYGVYAENKGRITVINSSVSGAKSGVYANTEGKVVVTDSQITGTLSNASYGIYSNGGGTIEVDNCQISADWKGALTTDGGNIVINKSAIKGIISSGNGMEVSGEKSRATLKDSTIEGGLHGINIGNGGSVEVSGASSVKADGTSGIGVYLTGGQAILHEGTFSGGQYALNALNGKIGDLLAADKSFFMDNQRVSDTTVKTLTGIVTVRVCEHKGEFRYEDNKDGTHDRICMVCGQPVGEAESHNYIGIDGSGSCMCGAQAAAVLEAEGGTKTYYGSLPEAWEEARGKEAKVTLLKSVTLGSRSLRMDGPGENRITLRIPEGKDLVGTADGTLIQVLGGSLTIEEGRLFGNIQVTGGSLNMEEGNVYGNVSVAGGSFTAESGMITGRLTAEGGGLAVLGGTAKVDTDKEEAILVTETGRLVMTGGMAAGRVRGVTVRGGSAEITGGKVSRLALSGEGIRVTGGSLAVDGSAHIIGSTHGIAVDGGEVQIAGGITEGGNGTLDHHVGTGLDVAGGSVTVTGGTFSGKAGTGADHSGYGVRVSGGSFTVEGGSFAGTGKSGYGLYTYADAKIVIKDGRFRGSTNGMFLSSGASALLTGGVFQGSADGSSICFLAEDGQVGSLPAESYAYREVSIDGENVTKGNWVTEAKQLESTSFAGNVTVAKIPVSLTVQPEDAEVPYGYTEADTPVLEVVAEKTDGVTEEITYQWYRDLGNAGTERIEGACGAAYRVPVGLTIPEGSTEGEYRYYCEVSCDGYVRKSEGAVITVKQAQGNIEGLFMAGWTYGRYDQTVHVPSYTCNSEGKVALEYKGKSEPETSWTTQIPTEAGVYQVRVILEETAFYTGAEATADFTVAKAEPSLLQITYQGPAGDLVCDGTPKKAEASPAEGVKGLGTITFRYRKAGAESFLEAPPTEFGSYEVFADLKEGDNYLGRTELKIGEFRIIPYETDAKAQGPEEWTRSALITAPEGFAISDSLTGDFGRQLVYEKETGAEGADVTYYLKEDKTGWLTEGKTVFVKVDRTGPSFAGADGGIQINDRETGWQVLLTELDYGLYGPGQIKIQAEDSLSGLEQVFCYVDRNPGGRALTGQELDELGPDSWTELTASSFDLTENGTYVIYAWAEDKVGNKSGYICSDGIVIDNGTSEATARMVIEKGIQNIPEELKKIGLDTKEKIFEAMSRVILSQAGYTSENMEIYDVELQFSLDGGKTWIKATKENFPGEGLIITLPYPEGTNRTDYEFVVTHMFTQEMNGYRPGQIETPGVSLTLDGICFTVKGLSPIIVAWKKITAEPEKPEGPGAEQKPEKPGTPATPSPKSGDETAVWMWIVLLVISGGWLSAIFGRSVRARSRFQGR
ncbi:MAG: hypothetical protein HFI67_09065 [Lachnospiraceae bacterium]|nr:hypothetical protein [Lachnospiraceae bacterium]